jgi:hypothetical protein
MVLIFLLAFLVIALSAYVANFALLGTVSLISIVFLIFLFATKVEPFNYRAIIYSVFAANMAYIFLTLLTAFAFTQYGVARNAVRLFGQKSSIPIYVYQMPEVARELALYVNAPCFEVENTAPLTAVKGNYYLLVRGDQSQQLHFKPAQFRRLAAMKLAVHRTGTFDKLLRLAKGTGPLETIDFLQFYAP